MIQVRSFQRSEQCPGRILEDLGTSVKQQRATLSASGYSVAALAGISMTTAPVRRTQASKPGCLLSARVRPHVKCHKE